MTFQGYSGWTGPLGLVRHGHL